MTCRHPPEARISYRDRAAPLGMEGQQHCDLCGEPVPPDHDRLSGTASAAEIIDFAAALEMRREAQEREWLDLAAALARGARLEGTVTGYVSAAIEIEDIYALVCPKQELADLAAELRTAADAVRLERRRSGDAARARQREECV